MSFDIVSLVKFEPPKFLCQQCAAIYSADITHDWQNRFSKCDVCGVAYTDGNRFKFFQADKFLTQRSNGINNNNLIGHARHLAFIADTLRRALVGDKDLDYNSPVNSLLQCVAAAKSCIHFTSYGLDLVLFGVLKLAAISVPVRGVVSNPAEAILSEIRTLETEAPDFEISIFERYENVTDAIPHQKLLIIDGLLAFKGSVNLSSMGWRKAEGNREILECVTDVPTVIDMNNRFFSPVWASKRKRVEVIEMD